MALHSSTLAWKIPWTEELVGCSPWRPKGQTHVSCIKVDSLLLGSIGYGQLKIQERDRLNNLPN